MCYFFIFLGIYWPDFLFFACFLTFQSRQFSSDKWLQRLKELSSKNQLIEQHTHFYKETKGPYDLSWKNLEKRLLEDKNWLASHEFKIKGFVGGGWAINKDLLKLLTMHDYLYDCSVAGFKSNYSNVMTAPNPTKFTLQSKYLVEIPTFSRLPLKRALSVFVLNKKPFFRSNNLEFCIFYLHDYDLLQFQNRIALKAFLLLLSRKYKFVTTRQLMEYLNLNSLPIIDLGK